MLNKEVLLKAKQMQEIANEIIDCDCEEVTTDNYERGYIENLNNAYCELCDSLHAFETAIELITKKEEV
jgi:hypothetical protein